MKNPTSNLTIPAGNLEPRNIDSIVTIGVGGGIMVGTLEAYTIMPDGEHMNLKLRGCPAIDVKSRQMIELSRSSDYTSRIARSLSVHETLTQILVATNKSVDIASNMSDAIHDIADAVDDTDSPESPAKLDAVTPLMLAAA